MLRSHKEDQPIFDRVRAIIQRLLKLEFGLHNNVEKKAKDFKKTVEIVIGEKELSIGGS